MSTGLLHRLRERGVVLVAAIYTAIAWLILQIASAVLEPLGEAFDQQKLILAFVPGLPWFKTLEVHPENARIPAERQRGVGAAHAEMLKPEAETAGTARGLRTADEPSGQEPGPSGRGQSAGSSPYTCGDPPKTSIVRRT